MFRLAGSILVFAFLLCVAGCDPVTGTGPGTPPNPKIYLRADPSTQTAVITLVAGHPASDFQFNYDGYGSGSLIITVPVGWQVTVQCENHGTVPNSCAVVAGNRDTEPMEPGWSTPDPLRGLDPGQSASFQFSPVRTGSYRIASLVGGNEESGMWADLEVVASGEPTMTAG
jgi:hypothetical protein